MHSRDFISEQWPWILCLLLHVELSLVHSDKLNPHGQLWCFWETINYPQRNLEMQSASQLIWINYGQNPTVSGIFCTWPHNGRKEPLIGNQTPLTDVIVVVARTARISKAICCSGAMFEGFDEDANCEVGLGRKKHFICGERSHSIFWIDFCLGTCLSCLQEPLFLWENKRSL